MDPKEGSSRLIAPGDEDTIEQDEGSRGTYDNCANSESEGFKESDGREESEEECVGIEELKCEYRNKQDIIDKVATYHARILRPFKVGCAFLAQFAFVFSFGRPPKLIAHSCEAGLSSQMKNRFCTAKYLIKNTELRDYFQQFDQRSISPVMLQRKAEKLGISASYMNCVNAFKRLMKEIYGDDFSQYPCVPAYIEALAKYGHKACYEVEDGTFVRLAIIYREGIQAFSQYPERGLSIDGIFLKTLIGGALLVACFRNGNLELQIVGIAIVSIENQANWDSFLRFLMTNLEAQPRFLISDRDQGLVPAVTSLDPAPHHFFCFRHLMENFNKKFKSKVLKNIAWALACTLTLVQFEKHAALLKSMNPSAEMWLMGVGKKKWSLCYSPCARFGTLTSNNVESVNGALRNIRKLPILDCLMAIERYVGAKWVSRSVNILKWELLTHRANNRMDSALGFDSNILVTQYSESSFVATEFVKRGDPPIEYTVQLFESSVVCPCGYTENMGAPCIHSFACLRKANLLSNVHRYFDRTWASQLYHAAYKQEDPSKLSPRVVKDSLIASDCSPPKIIKRRGRPKKKNRRENQTATLALKKQREKKRS